MGWAKNRQFLAVWFSLVKLQTHLFSKNFHGAQVPYFQWFTLVFGRFVRLCDLENAVFPIPCDMLAASSRDRRHNSQGRIRTMQNESWKLAEVRQLLAWKEMWAMPTNSTFPAARETLAELREVEQVWQSLAEAQGLALASDIYSMLAVTASSRLLETIYGHDDRRERRSQGSSFLNGLALERLHRSVTCNRPVGCFPRYSQTATSLAKAYGLGEITGQDSYQTGELVLLSRTEQGDGVIVPLKALCF